MAVTFQGLSGGPAGLQIIDPVLSNVARQFRPHGFIYDQLVAPQPVEYNVGQYPVFSLAKFFAARGDAAVADDAATPMVDFEWSTEFYHCRDYRLRTRLTRKEMLQVNPALRLEISKVTGLVGIMALEREKRLAEALRVEEKGGKLTTTREKAFAVWEGETATIQADIQKATSAVYKAIGFRPNTLVITEELALRVSRNKTIQELIKYLAGVEFVQTANISGKGDGLASMNPGLMSVAGGSAVLPKKLFGLDVVVADGVLENSAPEGATATLKDIWGAGKTNGKEEIARVLYVNKNATWGVPSVAYSFRGKVAGGFESALSTPPGSITQTEPQLTGAEWAVVDRWQEPDPPAENIRAWECVDEHIVAPEAGVEIYECS